MFAVIAHESEEIRYFETNEEAEAHGHSLGCQFIIEEIENTLEANFQEFNEYLTERHTYSIGSTPDRYALSSTYTFGEYSLSILQISISNIIEIVWSGPEGYIDEDENASLLTTTLALHNFSNGLFTLGR